MKIYIIGICGTAMASLASLLSQKNIPVSGSDQQCFPPMSDFLKTRNIQCLTPFDISNIPNDTDLFIIGNSVTRGNPELEKILNDKKKYCSFPEAMKLFFLEDKKNIVVTGTHGKTTTTSLLTHIFNESHWKSSYLVGGIPLSNQEPAIFKETSPFFIIEGDEYDTAYFDKRSKFLHYLPETVIINNIEFDHADIFQSLEEIQKSFYHLIRIIPSNGKLIINGDDGNIRSCLKEIYFPVFTFGEKSSNDLIISYKGINEYGMGYGEFHYQKQKIQAKFSLPGKHNFFNAAAAFLTAVSYGISQNTILKALISFKGIKRRLNKIIDNDRILIFEDFAHHPTAIQATIDTIKEMNHNIPILHCQDLSNNTSYRSIHQSKYPDALKNADEIVFKMNPRYDKLPEVNRLNLYNLNLSLSPRSFYYSDKNELIKEKIFSFIDKNKKCIIILSGTGNFQFLKEELIKQYNKE